MRKKAMDHIVAVTKNDKQELATHKVKLNVVDRSQDVIDEIETAIDEAAQDIKKIDNQVVKVRAEIIELEKIAKEAKDFADELKGFKSETDDMRSKIKEAASELGVKPDNIDNYGYLNEVQKFAKDKGKELMESYKNANQYLRLL
jgi:DNA repair ATPase RecN